MVAEREPVAKFPSACCSLAKISMVAEHKQLYNYYFDSCSLAKISMVAELCIELRSLT